MVGHFSLSCPKGDKTKADQAKVFHESLFQPESKRKKMKKSLSNLSDAVSESASQVLVLVSVKVA